MTALAELLTCLHQTPGDDVLWLAVADRLEEDGEPERAELLRLSRGLRATGEADERWRVEARVRGLLAGGVRPCVPEVVNSVGMRFVLIPAGTFWMGSPDGEEGRSEDEGPRHRVTLTRPFWMGVFPVTQAQYEAVMGSNPSYFSKKGGGKARVRKTDTSAFPAEQVSWDDAAALCAALTALPGERAARRSYGLPSEAEWEYCCRGGLASGAYHFGDALDKSQANFHESGLGRPCPVGSYPPNAWGLHDMHGNVWEWCQDGYDAETYKNTGQTELIDFVNTSTNEYRVLRGGSWNDFARNCRAAFRYRDAPGNRHDDVGCRLVFRLD